MSDRWLSVEKISEHLGVTTTMHNMEKTLKALTDAGVTAKIIIGAVPVTQDYTDKIGADGSGVDSTLPLTWARDLLPMYVK